MRSHKIWTQSEREVIITSEFHQESGFSLNFVKKENCHR